MIDDFLIRAGAAGAIVALVAAPLGAFVVWRRMAFLGAAISHSGLLGVAFALLLGINLTLGVTAISFVIAVLYVILERKTVIPADTLLGILAHAGLAAGLLLTAAMGAQPDLENFLFGDILAVSWGDFLPIISGAAVILGLLTWLWRPLLAISVHAELARVEGIEVERIRFTFLLLVSIAIALAMKIVGILLLASLLVMPAAAARSFSTSPEQMAAGSAGIAVFSVLAGLALSVVLDIMPGPAIVLVLAGIFAVSLAWRPA